LTNSVLTKSPRTKLQTRPKTSLTTTEAALAWDCKGSSGCHSEGAVLKAVVRKMTNYKNFNRKSTPLVSMLMS
jgi:hypothetical protein